MSLHRLWKRWTRGERRLAQRADWLRFAGAEFAEHILTRPLTDRFHAKQGRATGRWVLTYGDDRLVVYVKRHHAEPWWRRLMALLWPAGGWSSAWTEWRNLQWAKSAGIRVPEPVAVGEFIGPGLRLESYLVIEELTGCLPLHEAIPEAARRLGPFAFARWKRGLTNAAADVCRRLHALDRFHKDLYLCHFFVRLPEASGELGPVHLIDLHRLRRHRLTAWYQRIKDLAQLHYSTNVDGVTERDRWRFVRAYLGRPLGRLDRVWLRLVTLKAQRYSRHNQPTRAAACSERAARPSVPPRPGRTDEVHCHSSSAPTEGGRVPESDA